MEQEPGFDPCKIEKSAEAKQVKDGYQIAVEAVDDLINMLKLENCSQEQLKEKAVLIFKNLSYLDAEEKDFFEVMPTALKLSELGSSAEVPEINMLSNNGYAMLSNGIQRMLRDEEELPAMNKEETGVLFQSLLEVFWKGNFHTAPATYDFLEKYKTELKRTVDSPGFEEAKKDYARFTSFLESNLAKIHLASLTQEELDKDRDFLGKNKKAKDLIVGLLGECGLNKKDSENILNSWLSRRRESPDKPNPPPISENLHAIHSLEQESPGIAEFLYKTFGIRNFERYPMELLLAQAQEFENQEKPYGIIINPTNDRSGAFSQDISSWHELYDQLKEHGYILRVMECDSKIEIARKLINLDRKYGENHKISFAFIGGHGTERSIRFGGDRPVDTLHIDDLMGRGVKRSSKFFEDNPTIVLNSCHTGADKGIREKLSETLGAKVLAPDKLLSIWSIKVVKSGNGLDFNIEYTEKGSKKVFTKGRKE